MRFFAGSAIINAMNGKCKIGIIGLGLIGGSIAIALKGNYTVVGCSRAPETVAYALENNIIHEAAYSYEQLFGCKVVFVCTPLHLVKSTVEEVGRVLGDSAIITDVGSVKGMLAGVGGRIIGGHPMAGTEQHGIASAKARLLENAYYILCDYSGNAGDLETVRGIVADMGAQPITMTADDHDRLVSKISHLPHMLAYSLVASALDGDETIVGSGFTDTTRIASSPPEFWNTVSRLNRENLIADMEKYLGVFTRLLGDIKDGKDITEFLQEAKDKRDGLTAAKRYMTEYVLYTDVLDRVGSIASIVVKLSDAGISIDNLQVINSREGAGGALRLEFKDEIGYTKAKEILK